MAKCTDCAHFDLCDYNTNIAGDSKIKLFYDKGAEKCSFYKPTFDVAEVVHSHWVTKEGKFVPFNEKDGCPARSCYCHRCNDWLTGSDEYPCRGNYCPNCGAKMDGKEGADNGI